MNRTTKRKSPVKPKSPFARSTTTHRGSKESVMGPVSDNNQSPLVSVKASRHISRIIRPDERPGGVSFAGTLKKKVPRGSPRKSSYTKQEGKENDHAATNTVLSDFVMSTIQKGVKGLVAEFTTIKASTSTPPVKTAFDANTDKNRYRDVFCGDESRVVLHWPPGSTNNYIHANFVPIRGFKKFICAQGPLDKTIDDFYRMIWEYRCKAVVMLCNIFEMGKPKCAVYYPEKVGQTMTTTSKILVRNLGTNEVDKILYISQLELSFEGETFLVEHIFWKNWPDRGVPSNVMACLRLLERLKTYSPVVVHCSAGIGRTGTIVGLEMAQQAIHHEEPLSFPNIVKELRAFRHGSVQTDVQYVYMHRVILGLAQNKKVISCEKLTPFLVDYEAYLKSRGC